MLAKKALVNFTLAKTYLVHREIDLSHHESFFR
jgi:hypothetical protein